MMAYVNRVGKKGKGRAVSLTMSILGGILCLVSSISFANETVEVYSSNQAHHEAFVLFYLSSCIHCKRFEPVLKHYAQSHELPILAYTLDGKSLAGFPKSVYPSSAEMNRFFPRHHPVAPALFLMDLDRHTISPVLEGEATAYQLDSRMHQLHSLGGAYEN